MAQRSYPHGLLISDYRGALWEARFDLHVATPQALATLPGGLILTRASTATICDYIAGTIVMGCGVDVARIGRTAGGATGLRFEETRTTYAIGPSEYSTPPWNAGTGGTRVADQAVAPDGTLTADALTTPSGTYNKWQANMVLAGAVIGSAWVKQISPGDLYGYSVLYNNGTNIVEIAGTATNVWRRVVTPIGGNPPGKVFGPICQDGRALSGYPAGNRSSFVWGAQVEIGNWATEFIGDWATRAGERLCHPTPSGLLDSGRLSLELEMELPAPNAYYTTAANAYLWRLDATNFARITTATGSIEVQVGGVSNTVAGPTWATNDLLDLYLAAGNGTTVCRYRKNRGTWASGAVVGADLGAIVPGANPLDLLCNGTAEQLSGMVAIIRTYRAGKYPVWCV